MPSIPLADCFRASNAVRREVPTSLLFPAPQWGPDGLPIPESIKPLPLTPTEIRRLIEPYVRARLLEQIRAVLPLAVYLALFQVIILKRAVDDALSISAGLVAVMIGLMFFMEGLARGLMPFGEVIGSTLPKKARLPLVLLITLLLGIGVTFAEPAIGALQAAGRDVSFERAPYLYALLNEWADVLVLVVGSSVGLAAVLGTLRFLYSWSLKPMVLAALTPVLLLTIYFSTDPALATTLGLAWDAGAVTTGPVTVPLVLALGIGIASAAGRGGSGLSGFGIVTLASLFPILGVQLLTLYVSTTMTPAEIVEAARQAELAATSGPPPSWYARSPGLEITLGVRAIAPLVVFLFLVQKFILRSALDHLGEILYGIGLTILGMCIFNLGLTYGLTALGGNAGNLVPAAFMEVEGYQESPLYGYGVGLVLALAFAWFLGFGATVAEPALNALGVTTEDLTQGVLMKQALITAVSIGVAFGIATGLVKIVFDVPLAWLLVPGYLVAVVLTLLSDETFVNVAWDSAGVTTGPITVPLVLAMGLGFGNATNALEGFGILCMASIGPIISVMLVGLWTRFKTGRQRKAAKDDAAVVVEQGAKAFML